MNKADKILACVLLMISVLGYGWLWFIYQSQQHDKKEAVVYYRDEEILRVPLEQNHTYEVQGTNGIVLLEVENGKVRVEKENSQYHYCSIQGWVDSSSEPIVCLPNDIVVLIESKGEDDVDTVIQ